MVQERREEKVAPSRPLAKAQPSIVIQFPFQLPLQGCPTGKKINTAAQDHWPEDLLQLTLLPRETVCTSLMPSE